ncbi:MAG: helix-turn-helix domain-containing protein, partial [Acutalibacteraceae bacterium]
IKVNVVRQTVSKWEKGLSVPDAEVLSHIAEVLEVRVSELLGAEMKQEDSKNEVAEQLAKISEQLAIKNRRSKKIWKTIGIILLAIIIANIIWVTVGVISFNSYKQSENSIVTEENVEEILPDEKWYSFP